MDIVELRETYKKLTGKKCYMGWSGEKLQAKIAELNAAIDVIQNSGVGTLNNSINQPNVQIFHGDLPAVTAYPVTFVGEPLPETPVIVQFEAPKEPTRTYKTDVEVIRDMQAGISRPVVLEYSLNAKFEICTYLYKVLGDGLYRARIRQMTALEDSKSDFIADLQALKNLVKEGKEKAEVDYFINLLFNLK